MHVCVCTLWSLDSQSVSAEPSVGYKIHTKKVSLDEVFQTTVEELFDVFTNPEVEQ